MSFVSLSCTALRPSPPSPLHALASSSCRDSCRTVTNPLHSSSSPSTYRSPSNFEIRYRDRGGHVVQATDLDVYVVPLHGTDAYEEDEETAAFKLASWELSTVPELKKEASGVGLDPDGVQMTGWLLLRLMC